MGAASQSSPLARQRMLSPDTLLPGMEMQTEAATAGPPGVRPATAGSVVPLLVLSLSSLLGCIWARLCLCSSSCLCQIATTAADLYLFVIFRPKVVSLFSSCPGTMLVFFSLVPSPGVVTVWASVLHGLPLPWRPGTIPFALLRSDAFSFSDITLISGSLPQSLLAF